MQLYASDEKEGWIVPKLYYQIERNHTQYGTVGFWFDDGVPNMRKWGLHKCDDGGLLLCPRWIVTCGICLKKSTTLSEMASQEKLFDTLVVSSVEITHTPSPLFGDKNL